MPDEAAIVRRIFHAYAAGMSPRAIAAALNRDRVPAPRGPSWAAVTLNGNAARRTGILRTDLYDGRILWNRVRMVKYPDTGRRVSRPNAPADWHHAAAEHLRIVPADLWQAVQARKHQRSSGPLHQTRKPKHLLSGLLRCGECAGGMSVKDRKRGRIRITCTRAREGGLCTNRRPYDLERVERAVTASLRERLADREAIALYVKTYNAEHRRLAADASRDRARHESALARCQRVLDNAIADCVHERISDAEADALLPVLRAARDGARASLAAADTPPRVISLHPGAIGAYLAAEERLDETIRHAMAEGGETSADAFRELIDTVTVIPPAEADTTPTLEIAGRLNRLIGGNAFPQARVTAAVMGGSLVAEEGLEPPTRGL